MIAIFLKKDSGMKPGTVQCNLTGVTLGLNPEWPEDDVVQIGVPSDGNLQSQPPADDDESLQFAKAQGATEDFWSDNFEKTLFGALKPAFDSEPKVLEPVKCIPVDGCAGLFLLPGHLGLGEYEVQLGIAQELARSMMALRNLPGAIHYLLQQTAESLGADYVIVDMSPSLGALNQNLVSISDLLIVPTAPDFFSIMALQSLSRVLPRWARWAQAASENQVLAEASYPFPQPRLKLGGVIIQRYRLYRSPTDQEPYGTPTGPFRAWINKVEEASEEQFVPALRDAGLAFTQDEYLAADVPRSAVLGQIQEFNSLLPKSQEFRVPVFELTPEQLQQVGIVLEGSQRQIESLHRNFLQLASKVQKLLDTHAL